MKIILHIERLVIEGIPLSSREATRSGAEMSAEVTRLLAAEPVPSRLQIGGAMPHLAAPILTLGRDNVPEMIGKQIAQAVHRGLAEAS
jgi:hypothetical protein